MRLSRRCLLGAMGLAPLVPMGNLRARTPERIVTTSWFLTEALLAIGVVPLAISETAIYRRGLPFPHLPPQVIELGAIWEPNLELLQQLAPDLILLPAEQAVNQDVLSRIAPTRVIPDADDAGDRLAGAEGAMRTIAALLDRPESAERAIEECRRRIDHVRVLLSAARHRAVYLVDIDQGGAQVDVFGRNCILHDTMLAVGLRNAWSGPVEEYGWTSVGLERLNDPQAQLVYLDKGEASRRTRGMLERSSLWHALPVVRAGRVTAVPAAFVFGGLPTAAHFAELLGEHLAPERAGDD